MRVSFNDKPVHNPLLAFLLVSFLLVVMLPIALILHFPLRLFGLKGTWDNGHVELSRESFRWVGWR